MTVLWVALGAAIGAPARYLTDRAVQARHMVGSFLLGLLTVMSPHVPPAVGAAVGVGFCGALTTYSTFSYEIVQLLGDRARFYAVADIGASLLGGFGAVGFGWTLGTWVS
jgi:CrcB protein